MVSGLFLNCTQKTTKLYFQTFFKIHKTIANISFIATDNMNNLQESTKETLHCKISNNKHLNMNIIINKWIRTLMKYKNNKKNVTKHNFPIVLKNLIIKFSKRIFPCDQLLTIMEDIQLYDLLRQKIATKIGNIQTIFEASQHANNPNAFNKICDQQSPTITLIKTESGDIFGGFTIKPWKSTYDWCSDKAAFTFKLRSKKDDKSITLPAIFQVKHPLYPAIEPDDADHSFGFDFTIIIGNNVKMFGYYEQITFVIDYLCVMKIHDLHAY